MWIRSLRKVKDAIKRFEEAADEDKDEDKDEELFEQQSWPYKWLYENVDAYLEFLHQ